MRLSIEAVVKVGHLRRRPEFQNGDPNSPWVYLFLRFELLDECSKMRRDASCEGVVRTGPSGIARLLTAQRVYRERDSICFERDGFRDSTESYADEPSNRSGRPLEPRRRLSTWGRLP